jgi:hypothetical protein
MLRQRYLRWDAHVVVLLNLITLFSYCLINGTTLIESVDRKILRVFDLLCDRIVRLYSPNLRVLRVVDTVSWWHVLLLRIPRCLQ